MEIVPMKKFLIAVLVICFLLTGCKSRDGGNGSDAVPEVTQPISTTAAATAASTTSAHKKPPDFFCMIAVSLQKVKFLFQVASSDATLFFFVRTVEREGNYGPENGRTGTAGTNP